MLSVSLSLDHLLSLCFLSPPSPQSGQSPLDMVRTGTSNGRALFRLMKKWTVSPTPAVLSCATPHRSSPLPSLSCSRLTQWLSFHHRAFNQNPDPDQHQGRVPDRDQSQRQDLKQSSLRKVVEISDLFRFISEFVLSGVSDSDFESEDSGSGGSESEDSGSGSLPSLTGSSLS
jgi:hypothetical protein